MSKWRPPVERWWEPDPELVLAHTFIKERIDRGWTLGRALALALEAHPSVDARELADLLNGY